MPQVLPVEPAPGRERFLGPLPRPRIAFRFDDPPHDCDHQSQRKVSDGHRNRMRHIRYADAAALRCREVDPGKTSPEARNELELRHEIDLAPAHTVRNGGDDRTHAGSYLLDELETIRRAPDFVDRVFAFERLERRNVDLSRYEDFGFHHEWVGG